ncbi:uncharacterized protein LACBIDRAFT_315272 [Laccaria bicolor S238N-H82]|uniref:Predicted protein n=1 Tax=Laccaria bicolor (strain S238N-H82 / ATCC MYA-4686) TaxID=486041 RepID=B0E081_LACBS|nr:uncharacterized protein LACBIDRAFT_315272 [Laccaria bicolor S238N-H82]EDQ99739.1 predicted protein [Laccaria bicolor S238N-H82]|eukprot:XP_001889575.1 predicted protein [Laccaria bicolor S238N-H82]
MAAPAQFIDYVAAERLATSFDVGAAMLLVYDCSLTLGMEIEFVWSSPWGFMTVLYIVQRYLPFCDAIFLCLPPQLAANIDPHGCLIVNMIRGWLMIFGWILSEGANSLHFIMVYMVSLIMAIPSNLDPTRMGSMETRSAYWCLSDIPNYARNRGGNICDENLPSRPAITKPYPEFVGCFFTSANHIVYVNWVVFMIYEAVILVLMIIPGIASYRRGGNADLHHVIYGEGIIMYIYLVGKRRSARHIHCAKAAKALSIVNVVVVCALSREYLAVIATVERVLHALLTSRVVLHLREYIKMRQPSCTDGLTDLHVDLDASQPKSRLQKRWRV